MKQYYENILYFNLPFTYIDQSKWLVIGHRQPVPGASQIELYRDIIEGKSVAVVANQTSMCGQNHLVDNLLSIGIDIKVFFPRSMDSETLLMQAKPLKTAKILKQVFPL